MENVYIAKANTVKTNLTHTVREDSIYIQGVCKKEIP